MVNGYGGVTPHEAHVTFLVLSGVKEDAFVFPAIFVSVLLAGFARKNENKRVLCWYRDTALLLAPEPFVNILSAVNMDPPARELVLGMIDAVVSVSEVNQAVVAAPTI